MSLRNRLSAALDAFLADPDRVVYLQDAPGGSHRQALMEGMCAGGGTDASALRSVSKTMEVNDLLSEQRRMGPRNKRARVIRERECAYCGGGDDAYDGTDLMGEWYERDDGEWAHRGCSPRP